MSKNIDGIIYSDDMKKLLYAYARDQITHVITPAIKSRQDLIRVI